MQARLIRRCRPTSRCFNQTPELITYPDGDGTRGVLEIGTIIDNPDAFALVQYGNAEPADDECRAELASRRWKPADLKAAFELQERRQAGIVDAIEAGGDVVDVDQLIQDAIEEGYADDTAIADG